MTNRPLTCEEVRRIDQIAIDRFGMCGLVLMENAGRAAAERIDAFVSLDCPVVIVCGKGNNAGDGYVIARHLELLDRMVEIASLVPIESLSGDVSINARIAERAGIPITVVDHSRLLAPSFGHAGAIVDCLLGTGAQGAPRGLFADAVREANATDATKIAIDVPTGLDADTGHPHDPTFRADLTITFVAPKVGFTTPEASGWVGKTEVVAIGVPRVLLQEMGFD